MRIYLLILPYLLLFFLGCTRPSSRMSKVLFNVTHSKNSGSYLKINQQGSSTLSWQLPDITSNSDLTCFGVLVSYQLPASSAQCTDSNQNIILKPNLVAGMIRVNQTLELDVPQGSDRHFQIIGLKSIQDECPSLSTLNETARQFISAPFIIGQKTVDLFSSSVELSIDVDVTTGQKIELCTGPLFTWIPGGGGIWDSSIWDTSTWGL